MVMADERLSTYRDYVPDDEGRDQLERMLHLCDHCTERVRVPPRVQPKIVESFLKDEVKPSLKPPEIGRAHEIARFYRVRPAVKPFLDLLRKHEHDAYDYVASLRCVQVGGDLGTPDERTTAIKYYEYILRQNRLDDCTEQAIDCYFNLDESVTDKVVSEALAKRIDAARQRKDEELVHKLENERENTLVVVKEAKAHKAKLLAEPDAAKRAAGLALAYTGIEEPGGADWLHWASYAVRDELERAKADVIVAGFRAAEKKIPADADASVADRMRAAVSRAIVYCGGTLTDKEKEWLALDKLPPTPLQG